MKKSIIISLLAVFLTSCGVGSYSVSSGRADVGSICIVDDDAHAVLLKVDGKDYHVKTVKTKAYKSGRNIKSTAVNSVRVSSGQHDVEVFENGKSVIVKKVIVSAGETKIIEL